MSGEAAGARLLQPRSVAIVGLSTDAHKHGARVLESLRRFGFSGRIWGVNPKASEISGVPTFPRLADVPDSPDAVILAIPQSLVVAAIEDAASLGAGGAVILSGGFAESGSDGRRLQSHIRSIATAGGIRLLGPNSAGLIDATNRTVMSFLTCLERPDDQLRSGPVALVTQSGGSASLVHNLAAARGSGLAVSISTGNEADLGAGEVLDLVLDRPEVRSVAMVLETIRDGPAFLAAARRAIGLGKPIVVCKVGRSRVSADIMATHTGALAAPWRRFAAVFDALGITVTDTPEELFDVAELLARSPLPAADSVGVITHSGGTAVLLADQLDATGVRLPPPSPRLRRELQPYLQLGAAKNPTDLGGIITEPQRFAEVVRLFCDDPDYAAVVQVSTPHPASHTRARAEQLIELAQAQKKPLLHLWLAGDLGTEGLALLRAADLPVSTHVLSIAKALGGLARFAALRAAADEPADTRPEIVDEAALRLLSSASGELTEAQAKGLIRSLGIPTMRHAVAQDHQRARVLAEEIGYPVVLKILSPHIAHKTELGLVRLGLADGDAVEAACEAMDQTWRDVGFTREHDGYLIEEFSPGLEVLLGVTQDQTFGPLVLVALGGVLTEVLDDVAIGLPPLSKAESARLIDSLRGRRLLSGYRGTAAADEDALAGLIARLSRIASDHCDVIDDIDLNPVIYAHGAWKAADAVIRLRPNSAGSPGR